MGVSVPVSWQLSQTFPGLSRTSCLSSPLGVMGNPNPPLSCFPPPLGRCLSTSRSDRQQNVPVSVNFDTVFFF